MKFILEQHANFAVRQAKQEENAAASAARHDRALAAVDRRLSRAVRLAVREARAERARRRELDARVAASQNRLEEELVKLAAAHRATEESLRAFIESLHRGGNGSH